MKSIKKLFPLFLFSGGLLIIFFICIYEKLQANRAFYLGFNDRAVLSIGLFCAIAGLAIFAFEKTNLQRYPIFDKRVNFVKFSIMSILIASIAYFVGLMYSFNKYAVGSATKQNFSIGVYTSLKEDPLNFQCKSIENPVLTRYDATDIEAKIVADPFLIVDSDSFYVFFEIWNRYTDQGDIAVATSSDGFNWAYKQVVLDEPFHLSYPNVFKYQDKYYMIPEATTTKSVRLYEAVRFPYQWKFLKAILTGPRFVDNTIFEHNNKWWLFTETGNCDVLSLFYADAPFGPWNEHPKSPVIYGNPNYARPGGNVINVDRRLVRFAQDDEPSYGNQLWAFEILTLTTTDYQEKMIDMKPFLKGSDQWNKHGMHQISACQLQNGNWIAVVDGF